jgi:hypothetical protein
LGGRKLADTAAEKFNLVINPEANAHQGFANQSFGAACADRIRQGQGSHAHSAGGAFY